MFDPADRRYGYPFLNCTNCGPRLTIITGSPLRPPADDDGRVSHVRRLPGGVRRSGRPTLSRTADGLPGLRATAEAPGSTRRDRCSARSSPPLCSRARSRRSRDSAAITAWSVDCGQAVAELRRRKHRDEKPFAVMIANIEAAAIAESAQEAAASFSASSYRFTP